MTLAGAGLAGCFAATLGVRLAGRGDSGRRPLARPRPSSVRFEGA